MNVPELDAPMLPMLAATVHDPDGRFLPLLHVQRRQFALYAGVHAAATRGTADRTLDALRDAGAQVAMVEPGAAGETRRVALRAAVEAGADSVLVCDFDRWLHWGDRHPKELDGLSARIARLRPTPWLVCLGRTTRAFLTHPRVQREAEGETIHALSLALGRRVDATAGAAWLSREGAEIVLANSTERTSATDLEWPALIDRADPRRLGFIANEGLEFETGSFFGSEIVAAGGRDAWIQARYERPEIWAARLSLAAESARALVRVLGDRPSSPPPGE